MSEPLTATIRMYRLDELGDCFLVTFAAGDRRSRVLIDCGSFRNSGESKQRLDKIVASIATELDGTPLDVVVATHQHNDHVSGFLHCETAFATIGVSQVWLSWLDDPGDAQATQIGTHHHNLLVQLAAARNALAPKVRGRLERPGNWGEPSRRSTTSSASLVRRTRPPRRRFRRTPSGF